MELSKVNKIYHNTNSNVHALKDLDFTVNTCGITMILGSSGCGKTTLLNIIARKDTVFTGVVSYQGTIEYIEQEVNLLEHMSVYENLRIISDDLNLIDRYLTEFTLDFCKNKKVKKLSVGQKKRLQFIRALLNRPDMLLCDEPTASLDDTNAKKVMDTLKEISLDIPVIMVTHDISLCEVYADRICRMELGQIVSDTIIHLNKDAEFHNKTQNRILKEYALLFYFQCKNRFWELVFLFILACYLILSIYVSIYFYSAISDAVQQKSVWRESQNLIVPQPIIGPNSMPVEERKKYGDYDLCYGGSECFFSYDLYQKQDIKIIMEQMDSVIGYRFGWDTYAYSRYRYSPYVNYEQAKVIVDDAIQKGEQDRQSIQKMMSIIEEVDQNGVEYYESFYGRKDFIADERNLDGFYKALMLSEMSDMIDTKNSSPVIVYQMKSNFEFPLLYGSQIKNKEDVILPMDVAEVLYKNMGLQEVNQLIGRKIDLMIGSYRPKSFIDGETQNYVLGSDPNASMKLNISGITDLTHNSENRIYIQEGAYDEFFEKINMIETKYLRYQYINFLVDPALNSESEIIKINDILKGKESIFVSYTEMLDGKNMIYKQPYVFGLFSLIALLSGILLLWINEILSRSRQLKEKRVFQDYGYHPVHINLAKYTMVLLFALLTIIMILPSFVDIINKLMQQYQFSNVLENNISLIIICSGMVLGIYVCSYCIQAKRSDKK